MLGAPVVRPTVVETTALGAAYAAGLGVGLWADSAQLRANWRIERRWQPVMPEAIRERLYRSWHKAIRRSLDWLE
jgi:glycerol kinase